MMSHDLQVQAFLEEPIGMCLYEWKDGQISHACVQGGDSNHSSVFNLLHHQ